VVVGQIPQDGERAVEASGVHRNSVGHSSGGEFA
jgi:hypothetical protein